MDGDIEQLRVQMGTESRKSLEGKYRLAEDPRYEEAKQVQRELTHQVATDLRQTSTPQEFGQLLDEKVIEPMAARFGNETTDSYGSRIKAAFLERMGEKARDEISLVLTAQDVNLSSEAKVLIETLPNNDSALSLANKLDSLQGHSEMSKFGSRQQIFETIRNSKVDEFEEFYQRENATK